MHSIQLITENIHDSFYINIRTCTHTYKVHHINRNRKTISIKETPSKDTIYGLDRKSAETIG